jgi:hypothetical protein
MIFCSDSIDGYSVRIYDLSISKFNADGFLKLPENTFNLNNSIWGLYSYLIGLLQIKGETWKPKYIEVMIWPYEYAPEDSIIWPNYWPGLESLFTQKWGNGNYSIFLDFKFENELISFLKTRKAKSAVLIGEKKFAVSFRYVFEGESIWRKAFSEQ